MLLKIKINKETLEVEIENNGFILNDIIQEDNIIKVEISKQDPENEYPWQQ
jgi:hypothetical protein